MLPLPITVLFLIAVNLIPLFGVLFFGWSLFSIMFLYWIEKGIIGLFNVFKIALSRAPSCCLRPADRILKRSYPDYHRPEIRLSIAPQHARNRRTIVRSC